MAFGGTRTYHRMTCAIEDAGFVIQDCIMWLYGSENKTVLKPSYEPIVLAYKPGGKRTMQVDECRVGMGPSPAIQRREVARRTGNTPGRPGEYGSTIVNRITPEAYMADRPGEAIGRWPANICHDGSDEVVSAFPELGKSTGGRIANISHTSEIYGGGKGLGQRHLTADDVRGDPGYGDTGSAARFFYSSKDSPKGRWPANICHDGSDEVVSAFPESAGQQGDVRGTEPSVCFSGVRGGPKGRHIFDARKDSGSAARFFYSSKGDDSTAKPVNLIRWLVRLVTPLGGIVLDPFAVSGSTGEAVFAEQRNAILIDTV